MNSDISEHMAKARKRDPLRIKLHERWKKPLGQYGRLAKNSPIACLPFGHLGNYISQHPLQLNWCHVMKVKFSTSSHGHKLHHVIFLSLLLHQLNIDSIAVGPKEALASGPTILGVQNHGMGSCLPHNVILGKKNQNLYWIKSLRFQGCLL